MENSENSKTFLRRRLLDRRRELPSTQVDAAGEQVVQRILEAQWFREARTIGLYAAVRGEVPLALLPELAPDRTYAFPRVEEGQRHLDFRCLETGTSLVPGSFGIPTPPTEGSREIPLEGLDLILVPGVAFDRKGNRMGHGGAYYDSTLPIASALRIGIAHDFQVLEDLPLEEHDVPVHHIVTPGGVLHGPGKAAK